MIFNKIRKEYSQMFMITYKVLVRKKTVFDLNNFNRAFSYPEKNKCEFIPKPQNYLKFLPELYKIIL